MVVKVGEIRTMSASADQSINASSEVEVVGRSLSDTVEGADALMSADAAGGQHRVQFESGQARVGTEGARVGG
jgi:hypothetical protein